MHDTQNARHSVTIRTIDSSIGTLMLAASGEGLLRVAFECENLDQVTDCIVAKFRGSTIDDSAGTHEVIDRAHSQINEYLRGERQIFELPLDFALSSGFRQTVQQSLPRIQYGHTRSYKELADMVGSPKAVRAVGSACATNPLPVVVPCHRVVRTDGALGGYLGGTDIKRALLDLEQHA
ncbi:MAG: methylated-DNA--[protein]-cysteine S-methyltransferase [Canibacter sp.]